VNTLDYLLKRFGLKGYPHRMPVEVPGFGRDCLARIFGELGFTRGAEIGVKEGDYSRVLLAENPRLHLLSIDPWSVRADYHDSRGQATFDGYYEATKRQLAPFGERSTILRDFSVDVARRMDDDSLDFVYIDGHHSFQACTNDIAEWSRVVRPDGIVAGHDYAIYKSGADIKVHQVVNAWTTSYYIAPWFVLGRKEKGIDEIRDRHRSFFWVKSAPPRVELI